MSIKNQIEAKLTKIAKLQAEVAELQAKADNEVNVESFTPNVTVIDFKFGKGEAQTVRTGTVLGVKKGEKGGTVVKALVGTGADTEVVGLFPSQIVAVR